ncbi:MAG: hypothetical protein HUJ98_06550 [Bacteroidaceae bacterium]|nr:hypothetical protein [Bacteroidaceae bacterium]
MNRLVLIACTNVGRAMIDAIYNDPALQEVELVGVVDLKPETATGKANYDSYVDLKIKYDFPMYYCKSVNEPECIEFLKNCAPDIIIQSGWSQKFKQEILDIPTFACIGEHPAPLPKGRGAACCNWATITGEREWGDTFFKMEMTYDTGAIYGQSFFNIELYDDIKTVYDKVAAASVNTIKQHLPGWVKGEFTETVQDDSLATHYPKRTPDMGEFDFSQDSVSIYNQIRGQARPYPGAFFKTVIDGEERKVTVWKASIDATEREDGGRNVLCGDGKFVRLLRVQVEGRPEQWACEVM